MSKRLSDSEVWKKAWFFDLPDKFKLFWFYILSDCDAAGIWTVNWKLAEAYLGKLDQDKILSSLKNQVAVLSDGSYWLIIDFIRFQYGYPIRENAPMYKKLNQLLEQRKLNLNTLYDTVCYTVLDTVKDKEKDKDKDKVLQIEIQENGWEGHEEIKEFLQKNFPKLFQMSFPLLYPEHVSLVKKYGREVVIKTYTEMENYKLLLKKSDHANLTAANWINRNAKR